MNRNTISLIFLLAILTLFPVWAFGQTETGQITGTIRDASGAVVSGAKVTVVANDTNLTPTTGGASGATNVGPNLFNYMQLPNTDGVIAGVGDSLQVPNQSIFCNTVAGGNPFTCSGLNLPDRNAFYGPGYWNMDWNFYKNFKLTERFTMQFRGEMYNIFNHHNMYITNFNLDVSYLNTPYIQSEKGGVFGQAGQATDERRNIQFALKLIF
ncbi:MAG: carboxypeptidase-like regulatory domain-containing protein [Candidatus Korobacteraceae bacterium]